MERNGICWIADRYLIACRLARCTFGPHRTTPEANGADGEAPAVKAPAADKPAEGTSAPKKPKLVFKKIIVNGKVIDKKARAAQAQRIAEAVGGCYSNLPVLGLLNVYILDKSLHIEHFSLLSCLCVPDALLCLMQQ